MFFFVANVSVDQEITNTLWEVLKDPKNKVGQAEIAHHTRRSANILTQLGAMKDNCRVALI